MRLNDFSDLVLQLRVIEFEHFLRPSLSDSDKKLSRAFDDLESYINNDNNFLINILKYTFFMRYISNNQIILFSSMLNIQLPINLHVST